MTLVIALLCQDGVILASDSQSTEMTGAVRFDVPKVFPLTSRALWGGSGMVQVIRDIGIALDKARPALEAGVPEIGQALAELVGPELVRHYNNYVQVPMTNPNPPRTSLLACGFSHQTGGWIVEVDENNAYSHYGDRGFHAIGSAAGFAQLANALMAHFQVKDKPLNLGKLVAYRAMDTAINTSAYGVGPPIQMWTVEAAGVHQLSADELAELRASVGGWMALESATLSDFLKEPEPVPETPMPEAISGDEEAGAEPTSNLQAQGNPTVQD